MSFNDRLLTSGALQGRTDLTEHLRNVTELFLSLAKNVQHGSSTDSAESDNDQTVILSAETAQVPRQSNKAAGNSNIVDIGMGFVQIMDDPALHDLPTPPEDYVDVTFPSIHSQSQAQGTSRFDIFNMTGNDFTLFPTSASADSNSITITTTSDQPEQQQQVVLDKHPSIFTPMSLPAPYTFSINEITFARRLQRAGFERAYHLVSRAEQNPEAFRRVFKLSLPYVTREQFTAKLRKLLTSDTTAPLDVPCLPALQLGGAGLHYQINRETNKYIVRYGPHRQVSAQQSGYDASSPLDFDFDWTFYEGEWFDSNDVEGYFTELGMSLNPKATFVESTVPDRGDLMQLLRKNGLVPAQSPNTPESWNSNTSNPGEQPVPQQMNSQAGQSPDATERLFQELGMGSVPGMEDLNWSEDSATSWLMGNGYKTPEFLSSGWNGFNEPSAWDASDSLDNSLRSHSHSPDHLANALRKVTIDLGALVDSTYLSLL